MKFGYLLGILVLNATLGLSSCSDEVSKSEVSLGETEPAADSIELATDTPVATEIPAEAPTATVDDGTDDRTLDVPISEDLPSEESDRAIAPVFTEVLSQIQSQTEVPILLPSDVPIPEEPPIYATATADLDRYAIELAFTPTCRGATACFYGVFAAKRTDGDYYGVGEPFSETVELADGVTGYFNPMTCGASCAPPVMEWSIDGVRYRMELKGLSGDDAVAQAAMTELANSAITAGSR